jgi:hypothetical protein
VIRSSFLSQAGAALRACVAVLAFAAAGTTAARAADIPADLNIDLSSIVVSKDELVCLALNDYWEARSETMAGRIAVAQVVMNRAMDSRFPSNICEVVKQNFFQGSLNKCQFSWFCDDRADTPYEADAWRTSLKIAAAMLQKDSSIPDPTGGALWYHADHVRPSWTGNYETTTIIGSHVFYRDADSPNRQQARKPFIYRLNAFAEYVGKHQGRRTTAVASAAPTSTVPMQRGAAPVQPIAR